MKKLQYLFVLYSFSVILVLPVTAQEKSYVAVLPFEARGVSKSEAQVVTEIFETSLVKTAVYNIIEQNDIEAITQAQAYSLSGCVDDSCAIEIGQLLSAEMIVLGTLSKVGEQYIANAKIIDVELGRNVKADSVNTTDIADMTTDGAELLAYKLAGLTYSEGGKEQIASNFGELYVGTEPSGADIFINGMRRGTSPMVIEKVPFGEAVVSARFGNMIGEKVVEIKSSDILQIELDLKIAYGRLFIKSSELNIDVYLGSRRLGPLDGGLFLDIETGKHILTLKGNNLYFQENIVIEESQTLSVQAYPYPVGSIEILVSKDETLSLSGPEGNFNDISGGKNFENIRIGNYKASIDNGRNITESNIYLKKGDTFFLTTENYFHSEIEDINNILVNSSTDPAVLGNRVNNLGNNLEKALKSDPQYRNIEKDYQKLLPFYNYKVKLYELENALGAAVEELEALKNRKNELAPDYRGEKFKKKVFPWMLVGVGAPLMVTSIVYGAIEDEFSIPVIAGAAVGVVCFATGMSTGFLNVEYTSDSDYAVNYYKKMRQDAVSAGNERAVPYNEKMILYWQEYWEYQEIDDNIEAAEERLNVFQEDILKLKSDYDFLNL